MDRATSAADPTDATLVARANAGDREALEALYRRHRDWVARLARRFTGDEEDALDVLQETFIYLFGKFPGLVLEGSLKSLLYPAVKHLSLDRRLRRRPSIDIEDVAEHLAAPAAEVGADLERLLARLPAPQREVVWLRFVEDLRLEDIAAALDVPVGTVKSRLHHALAALKRVV